MNLSQTHTLIRVLGEQSATFLQGQLTCDIREVSENAFRLTAHCNAKGRVLSTYYVLKYQGDFCFLAPADMATPIIEQLTPYARFSRVTFAIEENSILGCLGRKAITPSHLPEPSQILNQNGGCLLRLPGSVERYFLIGEKNEAVEAETSKNANQWILTDIQAGIAMIHPATSNLFTPHMLNYPALNAVSFKKGCYIGQEVIARTQYLGKTKRTLQHITLPGEHPIQPGGVLLDDEQREIGRVVNAVLNAEKSCYDVLGVMSNDT